MGCVGSLRDLVPAGVDTGMAFCKLHPGYKGIRKPTSKREGCTCRALYKKTVKVGGKSKTSYLVTRKPAR